MRIRHFKPFSPEKLRSLGFPTDPTDTQGLAALPTETLNGLIDRVYEQLDTDYPSLEAAEWFNALTDTLSERGEEKDSLNRPA